MTTVEILIASALEETMLQLNIIGKHLSTTYLLSRHLVITEGSTKLRSRHWNINSKAEQRTWNKLISDRTTVRDALKNTIIDIVERNKFEYLRNLISTLERRLTAKNNLKLSNENIKKNHKALKLEFDRTLRNNTDRVTKADQDIAFLQDKLKDDQLNVSMRLNYSEKWLSAKAESLEIELEVHPTPVPRLDHEARVHAELTHAFELQIKDLEQQLDYWRIRYGDDTAQITVVLSQKREQWEQISARRQELQSTFTDHEEAISAWLTFKKERAAKLEREKQLNNSATLIQAWWRGVMVRRGLGQFKHLKNLKKAPNKSKKK